MGFDFTKANETLKAFERLVEEGRVESWSGDLKVGVDLGTANIVLSVVDAENRPVAGISTPSRVVRDGIVVDYIIFGMNIKRRVCILSQKSDEIIHYILHDLRSGASLYEAIGAYDKSVRIEIVTIVDKQEYSKLMDYLQKTDPKAFVTVYSVNEVSYVPKKLK